MPRPRSVEQRVQFARQAQPFNRREVGLREMLNLVESDLGPAELISYLSDCRSE